MYREIARLHPNDKDYPARARQLGIYASILQGTFYDVIENEFFQAQNDAGENIPLSKRRPSVRYNIARLVVQDSISMLFGDERFPVIDSDDEDTHNALMGIIKESRLNSLMLDAALWGSIGSTGILMRVLKNRLFFSRLNTIYCVPEWDAGEPDTLASVTEKYKVSGKDLKDQGYPIDTDKLMIDHWFMRRWTTSDEEWYVPWTKDEEVSRSPGKPPFEPQIDDGRTVRHGLGFVPIVWIKNLPGGDDIDGECTFRQCIDTSIELDYQLSQAGRGLKYSSDPELLLKDPAMDANGEIVKGQGNAIVVGEKGDAKWLEIQGEAVHAIIEYSRVLRELALESIRGNRTTADKLTAAQSGRAMELMHQSLIWLAGELRVTYGEDGLLPLMNMVVRASHAFSIKVNGKPIGQLSTEPLTLRWGRWFSPTPSDRVEDANALKISRDSANLSQKTAVKALSGTYDVEDEEGEIREIEKDQQAAVDRAIAANTKQQINKAGDAIN